MSKEKKYDPRFASNRPDLRDKIITIDRLLEEHYTDRANWDRQSKDAAMKAWGDLVDFKEKENES